MVALMVSFVPPKQAIDRAPSQMFKGHLLTLISSIIKLFPKPPGATFLIAKSAELVLAPVLKEKPNLCHAPPVTFPD